MHRPESYLYESHLSLMSSYVTDHASLDSHVDWRLADEEPLVEPSTGASILGALGEWLADTIYNGLVALGEAFGPRLGPTDEEAVYWLHPPL